MPSGHLPLRSTSAHPTRDEFEGAALASEWNFLRTPDRERWSLDEKASCLTLRGTPVTLNDGGAPAFVGRRQQHFACQASAHLSFAPSRDGEEAGLTVYMNEKFHYEIAIAQTVGERKLLFRRRLGSLWKVDHEIPWASEEVVLTVKADETTYSFGFSVGESEPIWLGFGECAMLATEVAGGFTGVMIAMYATGNGAWSMSPAHFDWFEYSRDDDL